jgi:hypothetical protein
MESVLKLMGIVFGHRFNPFVVVGHHHMWVQKAFGMFSKTVRTKLKTFVIKWPLRTSLRSKSMAPFVLSMDPLINF